MNPLNDSEYYSINVSVSVKMYFHILHIYIYTKNKRGLLFHLRTVSVFTKQVM